MMRTSMAAFLLAVMTRKRIGSQDDPLVRGVKMPNGLDFDSAALWARRSGVWEPVWHVVRPFFEVEVRRLQTIVHYPRADHGDGRDRNHAHMPRHPPCGGAARPAPLAL